MDVKDLFTAVISMLSGSQLLLLDCFQIMVSSFR